MRTSRTTIPKADAKMPVKAKKILTRFYHADGSPFCYLGTCEQIQLEVTRESVQTLPSLVLPLVRCGHEGVVTFRRVYFTDEEAAYCLES